MVLSACSLDCPDSCSFVVKTDGDDIKISGNPDHPVTQGFICAKGKGLLKRINHPDRITEPLLKVDGSFVKISWEEAFRVCADKIGAVEPEQILHIRGFGYRGVLANASNVFFKTLGALETYGSLCDEAGCEAVEQTFGSMEQNDLSELAKADVVVNWGKDISRSSIHIAAILKNFRKQGKRVISISPGGDGNDKFSDKTILIKPGTDRFLAAAIIKYLIESDGINLKAIEKSDGFEGLAEVLGEHSIEDLCDLSGISLENVRELANTYSSDKKVSSLIGWGVQRYTFGGENIKYICSLCALSGQLGRAGSGFYYNISSGRNFAPWAETPEVPNDRKVLLFKLESELANRAKEVKFIWIDGINIANQTPDSESSARAIENCEFVVTVDAFMNDTAMRSNLILPCALTMERDDLIGSALHNCVNWSAKIKEPRGLAKSDFEIIKKLAAMTLEKSPISDADICIQKALESSSIPISFEELKAQGFVACDWPSIGYENFTFKHANGKLKLPQNLSLEINEKKGFNLLSLLRKNHLHSQIFPHDQKGIPELFISPDSPYLGDLNEGDEAMLATDLAKMKVTLRFDQTLHTEAAIIRRGGWLKHAHNANKVIEPLITDIGFGAAYYSQKAWVEKP
ncbi:molybdopterin-dependent oxidoreductase [Maridesulfovibrio frigidus]|uniref:molybdopterin-dependent oxidoreductase n=1 Tax=Maridesulfovibrio frigidus TaxID=340956 RepID=UPI0004E11FD7|nr:molybdopterin-dependent oxidoreductase [Maridesulfovibrio frigidus]